jgi:hypothetical protein
MRPSLVAVTTLLLVACASLDGLSDGAEAPAQAPADAGEAGASDAAPDVSTDSADAQQPAIPVTLLVMRAGTGKGVVTSQDATGVNCGTTCSHVYARGTVVVLNATALPDSAFTGWGTSCAGTGVCAITLNGDVTVKPTFDLMVLDVDGNRAYEGADDGKLISRYMFGLTGTGLTDMAIGAKATRSDPDVVLAYLESIRPQLDVDANGEVDALTDATMIQRYMSGARGDALTSGGAIGANATRSAAQIEAYLKSLTPPP